MNKETIALDKLRARAASSNTGTIIVSIEELNECRERIGYKHYHLGPDRICQRCGNDLTSSLHFRANEIK